MNAWTCATVTASDLESGELCLRRAKSRETLVEARSDTDVQIVHYTSFFWERKTNRTILQLVPSAVPFKIHHKPHRTHTPHHNTQHKTQHTTQHNTTLHDTTQHNTTQHNMTQYTTLQQHDHTPHGDRETQTKKTEREKREDSFFSVVVHDRSSLMECFFLVNTVLRPRLEPAKQCQVRLFFDFFQCILAG